MLVGSASDEIVHSFDEYWNDDYAFPVRQIVNANHYSLRYEGLKTQLEQHYQEVVGVIQFDVNICVLVERQINAFHFLGIVIIDE